VNDLKAALNRAFEKHRKRLPAGFPAAVKFGLRSEGTTTSEPRRQILDAEAVRRVLEASKQVDAEEGWDGDLHRLIVVLAHTGTRYSQAKRIRVEHVQFENARILIPVSKKGKGQKAVELTRMNVNPDILPLLWEATKDRSKDAVLLERWRKKQIPGGEWGRDKRGPWHSPSEIQRPWTRIIQKSGLANDLVPYALRHSSIVRHLAAGLSTRHVAALHDTSVAMIERHYAAFIVDAMDEIATRAILTE
jgi:integrase